jgi:hypothetical protein
MARFPEHSSEIPESAIEPNLRYLLTNSDVLYFQGVQPPDQIDLSWLQPNYFRA